MKPHMERYELSYCPTGHFEITKRSDDLNALKQWIIGRLGKNKNPYFAGIWDHEEDKWVFKEEGVHE